MINTLGIYFNAIVSKLHITQAFYIILYMSIFSIIIGLLIYLIQEIFDKKISPKWKIIMWLIFIISLIIPFNINKTYQNTNIFLSSLQPIQEISFEQEVKDRKAEYEAYIQNENTTFEQYKIIRGNMYMAYAKYITFNLVIPCLWIGIAVLIVLKHLWMNFIINVSYKKHIIENKRLNKILEESKLELNIKRKIKLIEKNTQSSPSIYGMLRPKILVNKEYLEEKTDEEIKYMFMHEVAHYKGLDLIINFVLNILKAIYFFNPFYYIFVKRIRQDIELKADSIVLKKLEQKQKKEYGLTIIKAIEERNYKSYEKEVLNLVGISSGIERRIYMIKLFNKFKERTVRISIICSTLIIVLITIFFVGENIKKQENYFDFNYGSIVPYYTQYVGDYEKVKTIVKKTGLGRYLKNMMIKENEGKYCAYLDYYTYGDEQTEKDIIFKKNAVAILSLVDNLEEINFYVKNDSSEESEINYEAHFTKNKLEEEYKIDLNSYRNNPDSFMKVIN